MEYYQDTQALLGMSGGLKKLIIYTIPSRTFKNLLAGYSRFVADNEAKALSASMGGSEPGDSKAAICEDVFKKVVSQGQTIVISSGDNSKVNYPSSSPNVVAVGGTVVTVSSDTDEYVSEEANSISGGGVSAIFEAPIWQKQYIPNFLDSGHRATPDIAFSSWGEW